MKNQQVSVSDLKAKCLGLVEDVSRNGTEYVVTKRGEPVARLVPIAAPAMPPLGGSWKGLVEVNGEIVHCDWSKDFDAMQNKRRK